MTYTFYKEKIEFSLPPESCLVKWLEDIAIRESKTICLISYIFCSDDYLLEINKTYLGHDYFTDIITFPYKTEKEIESDIFISIDRVRENADTYGVDVEHELLRVIVHGFLHMIGYNDKTDEDQKKITEMEDFYLELWDDLQKEKESC